MQKKMQNAVDDLLSDLLNDNHKNIKSEKQKSGGFDWKRDDNHVHGNDIYERSKKYCRRLVA